MQGLFKSGVYEKLWRVGKCVECDKRRRGKWLGSRFYCFACLGRISRMKKELGKFVQGAYQLKFDFSRREDASG